MKTNRLVSFLVSLSLVAGLQPTSFAMEGEISQGSKQKAAQMQLKAEKGEQGVEVAKLLLKDGELSLDQTELDLLSSFSLTISEMLKDVGEVKEIGLLELPMKTMEWIKANLRTLGRLETMGNSGAKDTTGRQGLIHDLVQGISKLEDIGAFGCTIKYLDMPVLQKVFESYLYTHGLAAIGNSSGYKVLEDCMNKLSLNQQEACGSLGVMLRHKSLLLSAIAKSRAIKDCPITQNPKDELYFISFSPDGCYSAHVTYHSDTTGIFIEDYEQETTQELNDLNERAFAISPDGKFLAHRGWPTRCFAITDIESAQTSLDYVDERSPWSVDSIAWSPDRARLAVLSGDGVLSVWLVSGLDTPQLIKRVDLDPNVKEALHKEAFESGSFAPKGGGDYDFVVWFDDLHWSADGKTLGCLASDTDKRSQDPNAENWWYTVDTQTWDVAKQPYACDSHILNHVSPDGVYTSQLCGNNCIAIYDTKQRNKLVAVIHCEDEEDERHFSSRLFWSKENALVKVASGRTLCTYDFEKSKQFFADLQSLSLLQKLCLFWIIENEYIPSHLRDIFNTLPEDMRQLYGCLVGRTSSKSGLTEEDLSVWLESYDEEQEPPEKKRKSNPEE